jgi:glutaredoxin-like YruB-family protein
MKVTVYSTPACPLCNLLKKWLKDHDVKFADVDVSKNPKLIDELIRKSGQMTVPMTEIDDDTIPGFDLNKLKKALKIK